MRCGEVDHTHVYILYAGAVSVKHVEMMMSTDLAGLFNTECMSPAIFRLWDNGQLGKLIVMLGECGVTPLNFENVAPTLRDLFDSSVTDINRELVKSAVGLSLNQLMTRHPFPVTIDHGRRRSDRVSRMIKAWQDGNGGLLASCLGWRFNPNDSVFADYQSEDNFSGEVKTMCETLRIKLGVQKDRLITSMRLAKPHLGFVGVDHFIAFLTSHVRRLLKSKDGKPRGLFVTDPFKLEGGQCKDWLELKWDHNREVFEIFRGRGGSLEEILRRADLLVAQGDE